MESSRGSLLKLIGIMTVMMCLITINAQKQVTLTNTTTLQDYATTATFEHYSFDTPLQQRGKLIDYDDSNVYTLVRRSFADLETYYFHTVSLTDLSETTVELTISDYMLVGMCQHDGTLDYFIGRHTETDEIMVCNINTVNSPYTPLYCKAVPFTVDLISDYIYADCKYTNTRNSANNYVIAIGGSSFDLSNPGQYNYAYAKFNTYYNFTETLVESSDALVSERLVDVKVDIVHSQIYVVLDINANEYLGASIYGPGDEITPNNPNIAILAYDFKNAVIKWVKIIGDHNYIDYYVDLEVKGNHVVVLTDSFTMNFTTVVPSQDLYIQKFRYETGVIEGQLVLGSSSDDTAYELVVHHQGIYILALIGDQFWPHPDTGSIWATSDGNQAFGVIWINNRFELVDIESYPESDLTTIPLRAIPLTIDDHTTQFTFISPASKTQTHGALYTQFTNATLLYSSTDCNLTCPYCSRYTSDSDCIACDSDSGMYLLDGVCYTACPDTSYVLTDSGYICSDCDYSCKTCTGPRQTQCASCCTDGDCESSLFDKVSNFGRCDCPSGFYESNGL